MQVLESSQGRQIRDENPIAMQNCRWELEHGPPLKTLNEKSGAYWLHLELPSLGLIGSFPGTV